MSGMYHEYSPIISCLEWRLEYFYKFDVQNIHQHKPSPFMNSFVNKYVLFWYTPATSTTTLLS